MGLNFLDRFKNVPVLGILRGITAEQLPLISKTIISAGLKNIEITMNTAGADILIQEFIKISDGKLSIGAGTVLSMKDLEKALDAGAGFIVMPSIIEDVIYYCVNHNIPVFPGALTPTEVCNAWNMGATMVKVFPASVFGPKYFKELKAPLNKIELMAVGGVSDDNIQAFFSNGASAAAFGASIFKKEWLEKGQYDKIENAIKSLLNKCVIQ